LQWIVFDDQGRRIDHSRNWTDAERAAQSLSHSAAGGKTDQFVDAENMRWLVARRQVLPGTPPGLGSRAAERLVVSAEASPKEVLHPSLLFVVCAPLNPREATLRNLAAFLGVVSAGMWLLAALLCRRLSRQALAPLTKMVESARGLDALDPGWYLDEPRTGDELEELGRAFNDLLARLEIAYHRQRGFSNAASHQLRTPLTILTGQIEVALRQDRPAEEYRRVLRAALARGVQLRRIVEALLFLGRADADATMPDVEPLELNRWIADYISELRSTAGGGVIACQSNSNESLWVSVHSGLLAQLIDNLLDNASKYGEPGASIRVETRREAGMAVLSVVDTGQGIADEDRPHVFEPFFRSKRVRSQGIPGVGLGLAIVERIAVGFGGTVAIHSTLGSGSRFEIRLPIVAPPSHPSALPSVALREVDVPEPTV
jgi:signal transduction histidine kinase